MDKGDAEMGRETQGNVIAREKGPKGRERDGGEAKGGEKE